MPPKRTSERLKVVVAKVPGRYMVWLVLAFLVIIQLMGMELNHHGGHGNWLEYAYDLLESHLYSHPFDEPGGMSLTWNGTLVAGTGSCGHYSYFLGNHETTQIPKRRIWNAWSAPGNRICDQDLNLNGSLVLGFQALYEYVELHYTLEEVEEQYPCFLDGYKEKRLSFFVLLDFLERTSANGELVFSQMTSVIGLTYFDDFGVDRTMYRQKPQVILSCTFPSNWQRFVETNQAEIFGEMEVKGFQALYESVWYQLVFRYFMGMGFFYLSLRSFWYMLRHLRSPKKGRPVAWLNYMFSLSLHGIFNAVISIFLFVEGWFSTGAVNGLIRDSMVFLFSGAALGTMVLLSVSWQDMRKHHGVDSVMSTVHVGDNKSTRNFRLVCEWVSDLGTRILESKLIGWLAGGTLIIVDIIVISLVLLRHIRIVSAQTYLVVWYLIIELVVGHIFVTQSQAVLMIIQNLLRNKLHYPGGKSNGHKIYALLEQQAKRMRRIGISVWAFSIITILLGTSLMYITTATWSVLWFFYLSSRWFLSYSIVELCRPNQSSPNSSVTATTIFSSLGKAIFRGSTRNNMVFSPATATNQDKDTTTILQ